ncbi:amino acid permease [Plasmopara halstedii]|uniref:Amino acid permease n=1 Tax=Plasmopara halstedii TaxID=4781 RepID=A0A0P1B507_PLAHL|nr:amino acid permease [Plasmopara halstedii]CEG49422.1 amino acid permease [Plasmopara halstedii]|eukprot:XP_024585791.1 amino acid permease [Plasmopara halstedii]
MDNFWRAASRVKPLSRCKIEASELNKCLTLVDLVAYGVGCSVGAGVYSLVGVGAQIAGPSISLSFLVSGIACIFTSLTYSEFAARVPVTGSAYTFVYITFGELAAWLIGWNLTLGYGISAAGISRSWASYVHRFLQQWGLDFPHWLFQIKILSVNCSILAALLIICCTFILLAGVHESAKFNAFVTLLNVSVLIFVMAFGSTEMDAAYWQPFMPAGFHGVLTGAGVVFFAYLGFDMVACLAEEVHEPQRTLPKGIIGSLVISMTIYVGVSLIVTGMAPIDILGKDVPLINAFSFHNAPWAGQIVSFGSIFGLTTAAFTCLMGQPRIFYQMAKDGLMPSLFAKLHDRSQVPVASTIFTGALVASIAFIFDLSFLANVISCGTLQVFTFVNAVCRCLSCKVDNLVATFQCPLVPFVPCMGILANVYMVSSIPSEGWIGVLIWSGVGLIAYLCYGIRNSLLNDPAILQPLI